MSQLQLIGLLGLLLLALLGALVKMRDALEAADVEGFSLWTCVAAIIAGLPMFL